MIAPHIQAFYRPAAGDIRILVETGEATDLTIDQAEDLRDALNLALAERAKGEDLARREAASRAG